MNYDTISFDPPEWLILFYRLIGTVSILINSFGIYMILFKSGKMDSYKFYLLWYQFLCTLTDVVITSLAQPILILPIWGLYFEGVLWKVFRIPMQYSMILCIYIFCQQVIALTVCFIRKHNAIASVGSKRGMSGSSTIALVALIETWLAFVLYLFNLCNVEREPALSYVQKRYPELLDKAQRLDAFLMYLINDQLFIFFIFALLLTMIVSITVLKSTIHMILMLRDYKKLISHGNYQKHSSALKCLIVQYLTSAVWLIPLTVAGFLLIFDIDYSAGIGHVQCAIFSTHSTINCIVMMVTYPQFRNRIISWKRASLIHISA